MSSFPALDHTEGITWVMPAALESLSEKPNKSTELGHHSTGPPDSSLSPLGPIQEV
jgi:hypothetical protein